jgi:hypothetical protein
MVIFCTHPNSPSSTSSSSSSSSSSSNSNTLLTFRHPTPADYLGSGARQQYLFPKHELEIRKEVFELDGPVLKRGQTSQLERWHRRSAVGHWRIMRTVLPDVVWENW